MVQHGYDQLVASPCRGGSSRGPAPGVCAVQTTTMSSARCGLQLAQGQGEREEVAATMRFGEQRNTGLRAARGGYFGGHKIGIIIYIACKFIKLSHRFDS